MRKEYEDLRDTGRLQAQRPNPRVERQRAAFEAEMKTDAGVQKLARQQERLRKAQIKMQERIQREQEKRAALEEKQANKLAEKARRSEEKLKERAVRAFSRSGSAV